MWWEKLPNNATIWAYNNFKGIIVSKPYSGTNAWKEFIKDGGGMDRVKLVKKLTETEADKMNRAWTEEVGKLREDLGTCETEKIEKATKINLLMDNKKDIKVEHQEEIIEVKKSNKCPTFVDYLKLYWAKVVQFIKSLRR